LPVLSADASDVGLLIQCCRCIFVQRSDSYNKVSGVSCDHVDQGTSGLFNVY